MKSKFQSGIIAAVLGLTSLSSATFVHADTATDYSKQIIDWPPAFGSPSFPGFTGSSDKFSFRIYDNWQQPGFIETFRNCKDILDPQCANYAAKIRSQPWGLTYNLPPCDVTKPDIACIESFQIGINGKYEVPEQIGFINGNVWPANSKYGVPQGGRPSLWKDASTNNPDVGYVLGVHQSVQGSYLKSASINSMLNIQVARYFRVQENGIPANIPNTDTNTNTQINRRVDCVWQDLNQCAYKLPFLKGTTFKLIIHVSNQMTGWFYGRMRNSNIKVDPLSSTLNRLSVIGEPVTIPLYAATVDCKEVPNFKCNSAFSVASGVPIKFPLEPIIKALNNQAVVDVPSWSLTSYTQSRFARCKFNPASIAGIVTSNATTFSGQPPIMDGSFLKYQLSALHFDKNGDVFNGLYELQVDNKLAKCLWNLKTESPRVDISITNESGETHLSSSSTQARNGFFRIQANGFTFSEPTIAVKLS